MHQCHRTARIFALSTVILVAAVPALAQQIPPEVQARMDAMQARIDAQQAQIDAQQTELNGLKAEIAAQYGAPAPATRVAAAPIPAPTPVPPAAASVTLNNGTATIASTDGAFSVALKSMFQLDAASYSQDKDLDAAVIGRDLNSGVNFRRARIGMGGKLFTDFDYNIILDFGGSGAEDVGRFHEAWLQYSGFKSVKLRIGEFAPNAGLEDAGSVMASTFLERASVSDIARSLTGGDTRMGISAFNAYDRWLWYVSLTGNTVSTLSTQAAGFTVANADEQLGMTARLAGTPFKGDTWLVHAGINYSRIINPADAGDSSATRYPVALRDRPELRLDSTRLVDTGAIDAQSADVTGLELGMQNGPFFVEVEAFAFNIARYNRAPGLTDPDFFGWYIEGGWVLTGETRRYNTVTAAFDGVTPKNNFDAKRGQWGAFELVARFSTLDLDYNPDAVLTADQVRGGKQDIFSLGLGWTLNPAMRLVFQGQDVKVERLNSSGVQTGQDYTSFAVRSQFGF
ncbi:OprO/OprP family phosphate-selective porin [Asticcacaulis sp. AC402]|uniref:OprO/OprP family phosphate-selective porin n=1 Tax=Asticcacaulis sp. AC402 TaxID=1282361 RepID=UPI0003C3E74E|nr:porin [Asticcacaulis sp. AC402]ESQ75006.1 hypothetical protein ABAC402_11420 [Asticcacaulis sp. AC402]